MASTRRTISLDPDVDARLAGVGNASDYLERLISRRWREWTEAMEVVRQASWRFCECQAVFDLLNGTIIGPIYGCETIGLEMSDSLETAVKWGISESRWRLLVLQVSNDPHLARVLWVLTEEFWSRNEGFAATLAKRLRSNEPAPAPAPAGMAPPRVHPKQRKLFPEPCDPGEPPAEQEPPAEPPAEPAAPMVPWNGRPPAEQEPPAEPPAEQEPPEPTDPPETASAPPARPGKREAWKTPTARKPRPPKARASRGAER